MLALLFLAGLAVPLAPDFITAQDDRQMLALLFLGAPVHQGWPQEADTHSDHRFTQIETSELLAIDEPLHDGRAPTPVFLGPVHRHPSGLVKLLVPADALAPVVVAFTGQVAKGAGRELAVSFEPLAKFLPERFVLG